ncbi:anti-sigma factor family protein [Janthinobacterium agaricidamnosum]|uniref:Transmembrane anti-sigma factor n=1 Tax=Janthinobacterium agaricidamnosum NBRC 102515 = DSM 9628 TaxID=1349767 RepID=W0VCL6_9BURK|nr:hypothetical protein [Janthinobacterium agaricidamnosum]CDG85410.1 putative uncharacterized protein [Janthinobacterium agaricidamnosum NBRC 102515 = DSM 9628]
MTPIIVTETELHAYVDGVLPPARHAEVEAYLAQHPDQARRMSDYARQNRNLRIFFNRLPDETAPPRLTARPDRAPIPWQRYGATLLIALAGAAGGWIAHGRSGPPVAASPAGVMQSNRPATK